MQFHLFQYPIPNDADLSDLNRFLAANRNRREDKPQGASTMLYPIGRSTMRLTFPTLI